MEENKREWENYGDVTPPEGGRYVRSNGDGSYNVVEVAQVYEYDRDTGYQVAHYMIDTSDIEDSWIDKEDVMSFIGMTEATFDPIWFLLGAVDYYGWENFGEEGHPETLTEEEVYNTLKKSGCIK